MRCTAALICLALTLSGCSTPRSRIGAEGGPTMITPLMLEPPPVYSLLGSREKLELTSAQITSLDSIATGVHDQNGPLIDQLREKAIPTRNQVGLVIPDEMSPTLESVRKNNRDAAKAVGEVLTSAQQKSVCEIIDEQRQERENRRNRGQARRSSRLGTEADSILAGARRTVWPWCSASSTTTP